MKEGLWLCEQCRYQASVTAGTIFQDSHLPLTTWFRAMWYVTSQKNGVSALGLQRVLGLGSYKTAWALLHKLRRAMVRPGRDRLRGLVEVDESYWGGEEKGVAGRLTEDKALIIVAAEAHEEVSGEFFDVLTRRVVQENTALIVELWYLDQISEGRIKPLTTQCGIKLQKSYNLADSIYWLDSGNPILNEPNNAIPLIHYSRYWEWQAGDYLRLVPGSDATLLAGMYQDRNSDYGVVASCFEGRVIFQTFCNHDYDQTDIQVLWENYIYNTLKNRFAVTP